MKTIILTLFVLAGFGVFYFAGYVAGYDNGQLAFYKEHNGGFMFFDSSVTNLKITPALGYTVLNADSVILVNGDTIAYDWGMNYEKDFKEAGVEVSPETVRKFLRWKKVKDYTLPLTDTSLLIGMHGQSDQIERHRYYGQGDSLGMKRRMAMTPEERAAADKFISAQVGDLFGATSSRAYERSEYDAYQKLSKRGQTVYDSLRNTMPAYNYNAVVYGHLGVKGKETKKMVSIEGDRIYILTYEFSSSPDGYGSFQTGSVEVYY
jgi:hypothetical protein